jgi:hypothetical protein
MRCATAELSPTALRGPRARQRTGRIANATFGDYLIPVNDRPDLIRLADEDNVDVGHIRIIGVSAAIANAVYHATGRRIRSLAGIEDGLLEHGHSDPHHGASDDLAACQLLVEDSATVEGRHDPRDAQQSKLGVDAEFCESCCE